MQTADGGCLNPGQHVNKIAVVGPGIVGMPMAAMLAGGRIDADSTNPAKVVVIQRNSRTSGWKVAAINQGRSPIGGIEPELDAVVARAVADGVLSASHDYAEVRDADMIVVCVQTDKKGLEPDYGPLFEALENITGQLRHKPAQKVPLVVFESTLAPSTMNTVIREHFERSGLREGRDVRLGNSPNRVMPGRLVERLVNSDKIVAGLSTGTAESIQSIYSRVVTGGTLHLTNSMTAEIIKTLENAYRDVRIAFSTEVARHCDQRGIDFYDLRDRVNALLCQEDRASSDPNAVPSGGLLIPTIGVGGHCLPKDGILLWWRKIEQGHDTSLSLILESRTINDGSPANAIRAAERRYGPVSGRSVGLLGTAYRFNSEDTRNSPTLVLARLLLDMGCRVVLHDPYVKPDDQNLLRRGVQGCFTRDLGQAVRDAEYLIFCVAHKDYAERRDEIVSSASGLKGIFDGCNLFRRSDFAGERFGYDGIGRGDSPAPEELVDCVAESFRLMERGIANEVEDLVAFFNEHYVGDGLAPVEFREVQRIAATCVTGCSIAEPGEVKRVPSSGGFSSRLVELAHRFRVTRSNPQNVEARA